jgi:hypothetical protein
VPQARRDARGCAVGLAALSPTLLPRAVQHDDTTARSKLRTEAGNARSSGFALNRAAPRGHGRLSLLGCGFVNAGLRPPPPAAVGVDKAASQQPLGHRAFDGQKGLAKSPKARLVPTCASEPAEKALSISSVALVSVIIIGLLREEGAPVIHALVSAGVFGALLVRKRRVRRLTARASLTAREIGSTAVMSKQKSHNITPLPGPVSRSGAPDRRPVGKSGAGYIEPAREGHLANRSFTI